MAGERFDTLYCSDLKRAVQTAELVFSGRKPVFDTRLREIARGELEGLLGVELVGEQRDVYAAMQRDLMSVRPPGGENHRDLAVRAVLWLESLPKLGKVVAVTHGGVIYALLHHIVGASGVQSWRFTTSNTGVTRLRLSGEQVRIVSVNDTAHLEADPTKAKPDLHAY